MSDIYSGLRDRADALHAKAAATKPAVVVVDGERYTVAFDAVQGHFTAHNASGEYVAAFNTRKPAQAKRLLREYLVTV